MFFGSKKSPTLLWGFILFSGLLLLLCMAKGLASLNPRLWG